MCRLKKEMESSAEKCLEIPEPKSPVDCHQRVRDIKVKGAPGTKIDSMKVYIRFVIAALYCYISVYALYSKTDISHVKTMYFSCLCLFLVFLYVYVLLFIGLGCWKIRADIAHRPPPTKRQEKGEYFKSNKSCLSTSAVF